MTRLERNWYIDGVAYDLEAFSKFHPGGEALLRQTRGRDISTLFRTRHREPSRFAAVLSKLAVEGVAPTERRFRDETGFLKELHERVGELQTREAVALRNAAYLLVWLLLWTLYGFLQWRAVSGRVRWVPYAVLMAPMRTCLAASGQYFRFGKASLLNVALSYLTEFDYRGVATFGVDADERRFKRTAALEKLPRSYRIPVDLIAAVLSPLDGILQIWSKLSAFLRQTTAYDFYHLIGCVLCHTLLFTEVWKFYSAGVLSLWVGQCCSTSLLTLFYALAVASEKPSKGEDWVKGILTETVDYVLTEQPYVDCLLTAGLSCRRMHRLLPFHWSPFACVAAEAVAKEVAQKRGIQWRRSVHLGREKLPGILGRYAFGTSGLKPLPKSLMEEHFSKDALWTVWNFLKSNCLRDWDDGRRPLKDE